MRIRRKFLQLTKWTYPYGTEFTLESYLPSGFTKDENENYYIKIGDNPSTMFACHLDTACSKQEKVAHVQDAKYIRTNGKTILGADDKAGMTVILYMIENKVPGLYYFFIGEEVGCIGSGELAEQWKELVMFNNIKKVVSFDRRGTGSVITHQLYGRCCSDEFAFDLSSRLNELGLNMEPDDTGIMTDSAKFVDLVPECTNISVGYYKEHTVDEHQDIEFLQKLCKAVVQVDWETLAVVRDPELIDDEDDEEYDAYNYGNYESKSPEWVSENWAWVKSGGVTKKMYISKKQIEAEKTEIYQWLFAQSMYHNIQDIIWNGNTLWIENYKSRLEHVGDRYDIMEMIPSLKSIPVSQLSDKIGNKKATKKEFLM